MTQQAVSAAARPLISQQVTHWANRLREDGYVVIPQAVDPKLVAAIDADTTERFAHTPYCNGLFYGSRTKRFGRMLARSPHAAALVQDELILGIVDEFLAPFCDVFQLNLTQAIEVHPGSPAQVPHRDQDMWAGPKGELEYLVNVMWPFSDYSQENGATMIWPGSHRRQDDMLLPPESRIDAEMTPGSVLLFLGSTLHSAGENRSTDVRRGMIVSYCLGWLKPYENQWLAYPPEIAKTFSPELAALVGYRQHRPNLGNFEGQCPSVLLQEHVPEYLQAIDELRSDQLRMVEDYLAGRLPIAA